MYVLSGRGRGAGSYEEDDDEDVVLIAETFRVSAV